MLRLKQQLKKYFPIKMCCSRIVSVILLFSVLYIGFLLAELNEYDNKNSNGMETDIGHNHMALKRQSVVKLPKYGILQGTIGFTAWTNKTIFQFLNVPYAEAPSGPRRFKAPIPIKPWNGIYNAQNYGTKCPTLADLKKMPQDELESKDLEDCLSMAIFSKDLNASRPVMVYIHGGGFYSNNADQYPPDYLMEGDIVLVVIQYRLDALGFLSTNTKEVPGNAGLMDSIQALKFIKENIVHFGGDSDKITIVGQSSGAAMVSALVISPTVPESLFHRAIIQSGSIFGDWAYSTDPIQDARDIAQAAGLNPNQSMSSLNRAFMTMDVLDLLQAVDKLQLSSLVSGRYPVAGRSLTIAGPSNLLPDLPENIVKSGNFNKTIPIIIGTTKDDGSFVATVIYDILAATNKLNDKKFMVNDLIHAMCRLFGLDDDSGTFESLASLTFWTNEQLMSGNFSVYAPGIIDMLGMIVFKAPVLKFTQMNAQINPLGTFLYSFDYKGEHTRFGYETDVSHYPFTGGVHHSDDLIFLFPHPPNVAKLNEADTKMAQTLVDLWTSFVIQGVPGLPQKQNGINALRWQPFLGRSGAYLHIDKELHTGNDYREEFTVQVREYKTQSND